MKAQDRIVSTGRRVLRRLGLSHLAPEPNIDPFAKQMMQKSCALMQKPISRLHFGHQGRLVHKWNHYLAIYERHLGRFRENEERPFRLLETRIYHGGSLQM
jgi:hypothetical protein